MPNITRHKKPTLPTKDYKQLVYDTRMWQDLRCEVLSNEPICRLCNRRLATEVDHIVGLRRGGSNDLNNLQPLCSPCHCEKTQKERL